MAKAVAPIIAIAVLIVVVTVFIVYHTIIISYFIGPTVTTHMGVLLLDAYAITPGGGLVLYARNVEDYTMHLDMAYLYSPTGTLIMSRPLNEIVPPGGVVKVIIPQLYIRRLLSEALDQTPAKVVLKAIEGTSSALLIPVSYLREAVSREAPRLALLANTSRYSLRRHWFVFDYTKAYFQLYGDYGIDGTSLVLEGYALMIEGVNEYNLTGRGFRQNLTFTEARSMIGSPAIFVLNPTYAEYDWTFAWKDAKGTWIFHVPELEGDVELDYLLFWEDLYYPPEPPDPDNLDDWKDHVVRVTIFTNGTYRLAVYIAKGDFMHRLYLPAQKPYETIPSQNEVYEKNFLERWPPGFPIDAYPSHYDVYEPCERVFYVTLSS